MKPHPIAELFPLIAADQLKELADNIETNGLQEPIIVFEGKILDGRNRYDACKIAKIEPRFQEYEGPHEALNYVIAHNLHRRHLSTAVRAEIAAKIAKLSPYRPGQSAPNGALTQTEAAKAVGVSRRSVQRAAAKLSSGKKPSKAKEPKSWSKEDLKKDEVLLKAFQSIDEVFGHADTKAIRDGAIGLKRADILFLAKLPVAKKRLVQDLIMANHWKPEKALNFIEKKPTNQSKLEQMANWCLGTKDKVFSVKIGGFRHTTEAV